MQKACDEKAKCYEVALKNLAVANAQLAVETMTNAKPSKEGIKNLLRGTAKNLRGKDVEPLNLSGYADSMENLIDAQIIDVVWYVRSKEK